MPGQFCLKVAQSAPLGSLVEINFGNYDRAEFLGDCQGITRVIEHGAETVQCSDVSVYVLLTR